MARLDDLQRREHMRRNVSSTGRGIQTGQPSRMSWTASALRMHGAT
jgi:hypothetical protein